MRANAMRGFLALALVVSLGIGYQSRHARDTLIATYDLSAAIANLVASHGMLLRENPVQPPKLLSRIVYFERPGCGTPSLAMPIPLHVDAMGWLARAEKARYVHKFIYYDKSWKAQDRFELHLNWFKHVVLGVFGRSPYIPLNRAIVLADPADCVTLDPIDWRLVWDRTRLAKAPTAMNAAVAPASAQLQ